MDADYDYFINIAFAVLEHYSHSVLCMFANRSAQWNSPKSIGKTDSHHKSLEGFKSIYKSFGLATALQWYHGWNYSETITNWLKVAFRLYEIGICVISTYKQPSNRMRLIIISFLSKKNSIIHIKYWFWMALFQLWIQISDKFIGSTCQMRQHIMWRLRY